MSPIIGTYKNTTINATLVIASADDSTGAIKGTLTVGSLILPVTGGWNNSTMAPSSVFSFTGSNYPTAPCTIVAGAGATASKSFQPTNISFSLASAGGVIKDLSGQFVRS